MSIREQLYTVTNILAVSTIAAIGLVFGTTQTMTTVNIIGTIVGSMGINLGSSDIQQLKEKFLSGIRNHDLQKVSTNASMKAFRDMENSYLEQIGGGERHLREEQKSVKSFFNDLDDHVKNVLSLEDTTKSIDEQDFKNYIRLTPEKIIEKIRTFTPNLSIYQNRFIEFFIEHFDDYFSKKMQFYFFEELKTDTRAWRAFQILIFESLYANVKVLQTNQDLLLIKLDDIRKQLEKLKDTDIRTDEEPFQKGLEKVVNTLKQVVEKLDQILYNQRIQDEKIDRIENLLTKKEEFGKPLLSIEEYMKLPEIKPLLKYEKFIGRTTELNSLYDFIEGEEKIMVINGDSGTGKTRLTLEFARQIKDRDWNIYFIYSDLKVDVLPHQEKILLILDEYTRYKDRDKIIASVSTHFSKDIKLLIIDRSIFKNSIENFFDGRNISYKFIEIEKGDIVGFLKEYCNWIDENIAIEIEEECLNSFDFAIIYAEYYKEEGTIDKIREVLDWKTAKYINDIAVRTSQSIEDVKSIIQLICLITPLYQEDIEYIIKIPFINYDSFKKVLQLANDCDILFLSYSYNRYKYEIKPNKLADYLRFELTKNKNFDILWRTLLPFIPYRISFNISILKTQFGPDIATLRNKIWNELNCITVCSSEYFDAITFLKSDLDSTKTENIDKWIKNYMEICKICPDRVIFFANLLTDLIDIFRKNRSIVETCISELRRFHKNYPYIEEMKDALVGGLIISAIPFEKKSELDKIDIDNIEKVVTELIEFQKDYPDYDIIRIFAFTWLMSIIRHSKENLLLDNVAEIMIRRILHINV